MSAQTKANSDWLWLVATSLVWLGASSSIVLVNKLILVDLSFPYPMAVSCLGMTFSSILTWIAGPLLKLFDCPQKATWDLFFTKLLPVGLAQAGTMFTGNLAYVFLSVSFIQMCKSLTPVITMLALFLFSMENPTRPLISSIVLTSIGTAIAAWAEVRFSWIGLICILASEVFEAMRLVLTQMLLVDLKFQPLEGLLYLAPAAAFWLALGSAVFEYPMMAAAGSLSIPGQNVSVFFVAAAAGFAVNVLGFMIIKLSSALSLKVLVILRGIALVAVGAIFLHEAITGHQLIGYVLSLSGVCWYNYIKLMPPQVAYHSQKPAEEPLLKQ